MLLYVLVPLLLLSGQDIQKTVILDNDLVVHYLSETVQVITHSYPWPANSAVMQVSADEILLIDTPYTPEATKLVVRWIKQRYPDKMITAINTGFHFDNLGGNSFLKQSGIPVWGSDRISDMVETHGEASRNLFLKWLSAPSMERYKNRYKTLTYSLPDHLFPLKEGKTLYFGGNPVEIYYPGPTHSQDNVVVYVVKQKVLFGGCMLLAGEKTGNTQNADMKLWGPSVRKLKRFDADTVIPGHGDRFDRGLIDNTLRVLRQNP